MDDPLEVEVLLCTYLEDLIVDAHDRTMVITAICLRQELDDPRIPLVCLGHLTIIDELKFVKKN